MCVCVWACIASLPVVGLVITLQVTSSLCVVNGSSTSPDLGHVVKTKQCPGAGLASQQKGYPCSCNPRTTLNKPRNSVPCYCPSHQMVHLVKTYKLVTLEADVGYNPRTGKGKSVHARV